MLAWELCKDLGFPKQSRCNKEVGAKPIQASLKISAWQDGKGVSNHGEEL